MPAIGKNEKKKKKAKENERKREMTTISNNYNTKIFSNSQFLPEVIKLLNEGHTVTLPLRGYSMRPFLEDGRDKALLSLPEQLAVGDVVLAENYPGHYVLHRLIVLTDTKVVLRGDGNIGTETCRPADIKAKALGFYRKGRNTLDSTTGRKWRIYSFLWTRLFPLRRYLLYGWRIISHKH